MQWMGDMVICKLLGHRPQPCMKMQLRHVRTKKRRRPSSHRLVLTASMPGGKRDVFLARLYFGGLLAAVSLYIWDGQTKDPYPTRFRGHRITISHDERMRRMQKLRDEDECDIRGMYGDKAAADLAAWEKDAKQ